MNNHDKPLSRDVWYTVVLDVYGTPHVVLIDQKIPKKTI